MPERSGVRFVVKCVITDCCQNPMQFHEWAKALAGRDLMPGLTLESIALVSAEQFGPEHEEAERSKNA